MNKAKEITIAKRLGQQNHAPYLTDRNAAQEIVQWFADHASPLEQYKFADRVVRRAVRGGPIGFLALLATPREICEAACEVWGMEDE